MRQLVIAITLTATFASAAQARVRLESICSVYGQKEVRLTGIGLVVGLDGTGDGGKNLPAMRALGAILSRKHSPAEIRELSDAKNVAMVWIDATIPQTGLRRGQRIDCHVSSMFGAKSLRGGRLLVTPLTEAAVESDRVLGLASGPVLLEDPQNLRTGRIAGGVVLEDNVSSLFVDTRRGHLVTLMLDPPHASFHSASEVARAVNSTFRFETRSLNPLAGPPGGTATRTAGPYPDEHAADASLDVARAIGPGLVEVRVPAQYHEDPVSFVAYLMDVGIDAPHSQARVVVNPRSGTVVVTGEVEISPVVVSHKNLTVQVGGSAADGSFVAVGGDREGYSTQQLDQLMAALNELRVPTADIISILRELHRSGKLHAEYEER